MTVGKVLAAPVIMPIEISDIFMSLYSCRRYHKILLKLINSEIIVIFRLLLDLAIYCIPNDYVYYYIVNVFILLMTLFQHNCFPLQSYCFNLCI